MKRFPKGQFSLDDCLNHINANLSIEDREHILGNNPDPMVMMMFGRWIRNTCNLWSHGTDRVVEDIIDLHISGDYIFNYIIEQRITHPKIPIALNKLRVSDFIVDRMLSHPDNSSAVIIEIFINSERKHG